MVKKDDDEGEVSELAELHKKQALAAAAATNGDAVSNRLNNAKKKGVLYVQRGEAVLIAHSKVSGFLKFDDATNFFYRACLMFKTCQRWREAGIYLCIYLMLILSIYISFCLSLYYIYIYIYIYHFLPHHYLYLSNYLSIYQLSFYLSFYLSR
jgi:hypothetical protein